MRTRKAKDRSRLIQAAMGQVPCDLTIGNVQFFNVITGEIYPASVDILDGFVVLVREEGQEAVLPSKSYYDGQGRYLIPGYIDTHMHIESTMMIPENLARAILPWGTTTICTDPHEIGNVMGLDGVRFMLENAKKSKLRQYVLAPSCVPSLPGMENAGAEFFAREVGELLDMDDVIGIAEIMDYVGVIHDSERMHTIIDEGLRRGMFLQGHAPYCFGRELAAYRIGGPVSDHESVNADEVRAKLRAGMHINLRASHADGLGGLQRAFAGGDEVFDDNHLLAQGQVTLDEVFQTVVFGRRADIDIGKSEHIGDKRTLGDGSGGNTGDCVGHTEFLHYQTADFGLDECADIGIRQGLAIVGVYG